MLMTVLPAAAESDRERDRRHREAQERRMREEIAAQTAIQAELAARWDARDKDADPADLMPLAVESLCTSPALDEVLGEVPAVRLKSEVIDVEVVGERVELPQRAKGGEG